MAERLDEFRSHMSDCGWLPDDSGWNWSKGSWEVAFDTSSWLELFLDGRACCPVPVPAKRNLDAWTVKHIEYVFKLEQRSPPGTSQ